MSPSDYGNQTGEYPNTRSRARFPDSIIETQPNSEEETTPEEEESIQQIEQGTQNIPSNENPDAWTLRSALLTMSSDGIPLSNQRLPKLAQARDYYRWKDECTDILMQKGAKTYGIIKGTITRPLETDPTYGDWMNANFTACGLLRSSISNEIKHTIIDLEDAHAIWSTLEERFAKAMKWQLEEMETELYSLKQDKRTIDGFLAESKNWPTN